MQPSYATATGKSAPNTARERFKRRARVRDHARAVGMFLRRLHPSNTAAEVEYRSGVPAETVRRWLSADPPMPSLPHFAALVIAYGPSILGTVLDARWLDDAVRAEAHYRLLAEQQELQDRIEKLGLKNAVAPNRSRASAQMDRG